MHLHAGDTVLDVGCGPADDLCSLAELVGPSGHVVGIDPSETMLLWREHKRPDWRSNAWSATPTELDFPSEMFAAVRADRVFQHLERPRQALAELTRVTRRDGRVVAMDPDWDSMLIDASDKEVTRLIREISARTTVTDGLVGS